MFTYKKILASTAALAIAVTTAGCASTPVMGSGGAGEWRNVPWSQYYRMGQAVGPEQIQYQQLATRNHCMLVAFETLPSKERLVLGRGLAQATGASLGETLGLMAEYSILGVKLAGKTTLAGAGFAFLSNIFFGGLSGDTEANNLFRSSVDACMARQAGGIYTMSPSEQDYVAQHNLRVTAGGQVWGSDKLDRLTGGPIPNQAPQVQASVQRPPQSYGPAPAQPVPQSTPQKGKCGAACSGFSPRYYGQQYGWRQAPAATSTSPQPLQEVVPGAIVPQ